MYLLIPFHKVTLKKTTSYQISSLTVFFLTAAKHLPAWAYVLIALSIVLLLAAVAAIVFIVFRKQFHLIVIPRAVSNNEQWN